jgi:PAS domain S-box-containing protein
MDSPDILIVHRDPDLSAQLAGRLRAAGYIVEPLVADLSDVPVASRGSLAVVDATLIHRGLHLPVPFILVAQDGFVLGPCESSNLQGIVYEPLRNQELETTVAVVFRRIESDHDKALIESVRYYALFRLDANGIVRSWNPGSITVYGYEAKEIIGKHYSVFYTDEDRAQGVPETELRVAAEQGHADDTRWLVNSRGELFWAEGLTTAILGRRGPVVGYAKITRDATERRNLEQQLERSNDELQRFAYTVSHDLQEPLRTIRSYAELLSRRYGSKLDKDADEFIQFLMDAAGRMSQLLKDLLAYSQAGRPDRTAPEPTSSANILQWAIMNVDRLAKDAGATITYDPLPMVEADQTQLSQVFQNLLGNAIKYRSGEPPMVHISVERVGDMYEFSVRDNGIGVDPEHHERIFGVFKRLHGKEVPGTGIGLAICRKIVESHGGRIWIESQLRRGSTVKFTLRAHD